MLHGGKQDADCHTQPAKIIVAEQLNQAANREQNMIDPHESRRLLREWVEMPIKRFHHCPESPILVHALKKHKGVQETAVAWMQATRQTLVGNGPGHSPTELR
jgi:hypothetical protein